MKGKGRGLRIAVRSGAIFVALIVLLGALGWPVYVHPAVAKLSPADAIVVLGGEPDDRYDFAVDLAERGYAPQLLVSTALGREHPIMVKLCQGQYRFRVTCFDPDPFTTRGEARAIGQYAQAEGWTHVIVVTFTPHISRARYITERCFDGRVDMVASPTHLSPFAWARNYVYQSVGFLKAFTENGC